MIGYDLVSLDEVHTHRLSNRFIEKTITLKERGNLVPDLLDPETFWSCWSIKESCYKAIPASLQKKFNPHNIEIQNFNPGKSSGMAIASCGSTTIYAIVNKTKAYIESVSALSENDLLGVAVQRFRFLQKDVHRINDEIRQKVIRQYQSRYNQFFSLEYSDLGKPMIRYGKFLSESISISHHGHWGGFASGPHL